MVSEAKRNLTVYGWKSCIDYIAKMFWILDLEGAINWTINSKRGKMIRFQLFLTCVKTAKHTTFSLFSIFSTVSQMGVSISEFLSLLKLYLQVFLQFFIYLNLIITNFPTLHPPLKTSLNQRFSGVFWGYKMGTLARYGLINQQKFSDQPTQP